MRWPSLPALEAVCGVSLLVHAMLDLRRSHPRAPALDVLDLAMQGHYRSVLDFKDPATPGGDHTDPLSPFGQLLGQAFAPHLDEDYCAAQALDLDEAWHLGVLEAF